MLKTALHYHKGYTNVKKVSNTSYLCKPSDCRVNMIYGVYRSSFTKSSAAFRVHPWFIMCSILASFVVSLVVDRFLSLDFATASRFSFSVLLAFLEASLHFSEQK
jgi:hypothetical protein